MLNETLKSELYAAYQSGGVGAATGAATAVAADSGGAGTRTRDQAITTRDRHSSIRSGVSDTFTLPGETGRTASAPFSVFRPPDWPGPRPSTRSGVGRTVPA